MGQQKDDRQQAGGGKSRQEREADSQKNELQKAVDDHVAHENMRRNQ